MGEILRFLILLVLTRAADRDVDVCAQVAVLHVAVTGAKVTHDLAQLGDIGGGFLGATDVRARDDFHQAHAGAVQVHKRHRRVHVVDRLAGVLFHVDALNPHHACSTIAKLHQHFAFAHDGVIELRDLIALRQVGVEIVLAVKGGPEVDVCLEAKARAHRLFDAIFVDHRQHAGHRRIHKGHVRVGLGAELGRGPREELGIGAHLGMHLHADDQFPVMLGTRDHLGLGEFICQVEHRAALLAIDPCVPWRSRRESAQEQGALVSGPRGSAPLGAVCPLGGRRDPG